MTLLNLLADISRIKIYRNGRSNKISGHKKLRILREIWGQNFFSFVADGMYAINKSVPFFRSHHGLFISPEGHKLCGGHDGRVCYPIVDVETGPLIDAGKPYWATVSADGTACVISESDDDVFTVIDFETGNKLLSVDVGNHPRRVRLGSVPAGWTGPAD